MLPVPLDLGFSLEHCTFIREKIAGRTRDNSSMPEGGTPRRPHDAEPRFPATLSAGPDAAGFPETASALYFPVSSRRSRTGRSGDALAVERRNNENHEKSN
jgi:hypothetical protein